MNLIERTLAELKRGTIIQLETKTGKTINGIITENDRTNSLAIEVTTQTILTYDQITSIDTLHYPTLFSQPSTTPTIPKKQTSPISPTETQHIEKVETKTDTPKEKKNTVQATIPIQTITFLGEETITLFKQLDAEEKDILGPAHSKFLSYLQSHDTQKGNEAAGLISNEISFNAWENNKPVQLYYASALGCIHDFSHAGNALFYAGEYLNAYRVAYQGGHMAHAGAFAVFYLSMEDAPEWREAVEVLIIATIRCNDIEGYRYVAKHTENNDILDALQKGLSRLNNNAHMSLENMSLNDAIEKLAPSYTGRKVHKYIEQFIPESPDDVASNDETQEVEIEPFPENPDLTLTYNGIITKYNKFEEKGVITVDKWQQEFAFTIQDVPNKKLSDKLQKLKLTQKPKIFVSFHLMKVIGNTYCAVQINPTAENGHKIPEPDNEKALLGQAYYFFKREEYSNAIKIYRKCLGGSEDAREKAFNSIVASYIHLGHAYDDDLDTFVRRYYDNTNISRSILDAMQKYYEFKGDTTQRLEYLDMLLDIIPRDDYNSVLYYTAGRARCYRSLQRYEEAIEQLQEWLQFAEENNVADPVPSKEGVVYIELAELYYNIGYLDKAEEYAELSDPKNVVRKRSLLQDIYEARQIENEIDTDNAPLSSPCNVEDDIPEEDEDISDENGDDEDAQPLEDTPEEYPKEATILESEEDDAVDFDAQPIETLYAAYTDTGTWADLKRNTNDILQTALSFSPDFLYCTVTYLQACVAIVPESEGKRFAIANRAFAYATNSPLTAKATCASDILDAFSASATVLPNIINNTLRAGATLRVFMKTGTLPDYSMSSLLDTVAETPLENYPTLPSLMENLRDFYERSGGANMCAFAQKGDDVDPIEEATCAIKNYLSFIEEKMKANETQGQLRRLRELMFQDENSPLRECLTIAATGETEKYAYVRHIIEDTFIRKNHAISATNVDRRRLDNFIDDYWERARESLLDDGYVIRRGRENLIGARRATLENTIKRAISYLADWIDAAEKSLTDNTQFVRPIFDEISPKVIGDLSTIIATTEDVRARGKETLGDRALKGAAKEFLAYLKGNPDSRPSKYFFIDFLRGDKILLGADYLPEMQATFIDIPSFSILTRIEEHTKMTLPSWETRIQDIFCEDKEKHNFRSLQLIIDYARDYDIDAVCNAPHLSLYEQCRDTEKQRSENIFDGFIEDLGLYKSNGILCENDDYLTHILTLATAWYHITEKTQDYGFFYHLLDKIRQQIQGGAAKKGQYLHDALEKLSADPTCNFGAFSPEEISAQIDAQNYTAAGYALQCIERGDVIAINDDTTPIRDYFDQFIAEYPANLRAVGAVGISLGDALLKHTRKRNLSAALTNLTGGTQKEMSSGSALLERAINANNPSTPDKIREFLTRLGFNITTIKREDGTSAESYIVTSQLSDGEKVLLPLSTYQENAGKQPWRVLCLYGRHDCEMILTKCREINRHNYDTLILLDFSLSPNERGKLARLMKADHFLLNTFLVLDRVALLHLARHMDNETLCDRLLSITLPYAYYQPYRDTVQNVPLSLIPRDNLNAITAPTGISLVCGGTSLGKTSLLKAGRETIEMATDDKRAVYVNLADCPFDAIPATIMETLQKNNIIEKTEESPDWETLIASLHTCLEKESPIPYLLILLDDADNIFDNDNADKVLSLMQTLPEDSVKFVLAGEGNISCYLQTHPTMEKAKIVQKPLTRNAAAHLLTYTLSYCGIRLGNNMMATILASTGGYPTMITRYCQQLIDVLRDTDYAGYSQNDTPPYNVTPTHLRRVLANANLDETFKEILMRTLLPSDETTSNYHAIALILYRLNAEGNDGAYYTREQIQVMAEKYHITRIATLSADAITCLLDQMIDLSILEKIDTGYRLTMPRYQALFQNEEALSLYTTGGENDG